MTAPIFDELNDSTFDGEVLRDPRPTIVAFYAPWSGAWRRSCIAYERLAESLDSAVRTARLNVDDNPQTAANYGVTTLPTFVLFEKGRAVGRISGSASAKKLRELFERAHSEDDES